MDTSIAALTSIPVTLTFLDLSNNFFKRYTDAELASIFGAIPATVITVNWGKDRLQKLYEESKHEHKIPVFMGIPV